MGGILLVLGIAAIIALVVFADDAVDELEKINETGLADVTVTDCRTDTGSGRVTATLEIVNQSSKPSNYFIEIGFEDSDGDRVTQATTNATEVAPDQRVTLVASAAVADPGELTCEVVSATRLAS